MATKKKKPAKKAKAITEKKKDQTREGRISREKARLDAIFKNIEPQRKRTAKGLIERAAFMRVSLEILEDDLNTNGFTEKFSQGDQPPYDRKRPNADVYNSMNTNYQKIIKQLTDLLPREEKKAPVDDGFDDFVLRRDDG